MLAESILVCDSNQVLISNLDKILRNQGYLVDHAVNGKVAQKKISEQKFKIILMDMNLQNHLSFDVLRFIRVNSPASRVIFSYSDDTEVKELGLDAKMLTKLGICSTVKKPYKSQSLLRILGDDPALRRWQETIGNHASVEGDAATISDSKFTKIPINDLYLGSVTIFDFYIKLGDNKYLKFLNKGEAFLASRLKKYESEKNLEYLYFLTKDRGEYIEFVNNFLDKYLKRKKVKAQYALKASKGLIDHFVSEVHIKGFNTRLASEAKMICDNLYQIVKADKTTGALIDALFEEHPEKISYTFLTAFFSSITLSGIEWSGEMSSKFVIQAAMLHEIGKLKLPAELKGVDYDDLSPAQKLIYQSYPSEGFNLLSGTSVPQQIKQIIYQHREFINGKGYPNGLTGLRIFPLAKIVSFSSSFAEFVLANNTSPLKGMKEFIKTKDEISKYDSDCIKSFISGLAK